MLPLTMKPPIHEYVYDADESIAVSEVAATLAAISVIPDQFSDYKLRPRSL